MVRTARANSTVLGMISRLIARTAGIVEFKGRDITHWESRELAKHLAILTQANFVQMKLTVRELVAFGRFRIQGLRCRPTIGPRSIRPSTTWSSKPLPTALLTKCRAASASAPSLQWCSLRTLSMLLDEPTNNLDIYHATQMMKLVRRLCDELGKTVILVLHEINLAAFYSDVICAFRMVGSPHREPLTK